jgi:hypothetical protein
MEYTAPDPARLEMIRQGKQIPRERREPDLTLEVW